MSRSSNNSSSGASDGSGTGSKPNDKSGSPDFNANVGGRTPGRAGQHHTTVYLEVFQQVSQPMAMSTNGPDLLQQTMPQTKLIPCSKVVAKVSPVLDQFICQITGEALTKRPTLYTRSGKPEVARDVLIRSPPDPSAPPVENCRIRSHLTDQGLLVLVLGNPVFTEKIVKWILEWCQYHVTDSLFEESTGFDDFDEDEFLAEQERITELPCAFDWNFITKVGGERLEQAKRATFYDLMIAADHLGLEPLVLLGGKYICKQISGEDVVFTRSLLGLVNDLDPQTEEKIKRENGRILQPRGNRLFGLFQQ